MVGGRISGNISKCFLVGKKHDSVFKIFSNHAQADINVLENRVICGKESSG